jgi:hypothetical protein
MKSKKITNLTVRNLVGRLSARLPLEKGSIIAHLRRCFCALAIVSASITLPNAEAGQPEPASGGFNPCFNFASPPTQAGPNTVVTFSVIATFTGTFTGSAIVTERDVVHPDGSITFHGSGVFADQSNCGTFLFTYSGKGSTVTGSESAHFVGGRGTGCFAGVHTEGTFQGTLVGPSVGCAVAGAGTYNGQIMFAPHPTPTPSTPTPTPTATIAPR